MRAIGVAFGGFPTAGRGQRHDHSDGLPGAGRGQRHDHSDGLPGAGRGQRYDQIASNAAWSNGTSQHSAIRPSATRNTPTVSQ